MWYKIKFSAHPERFYFTDLDLNELSNRLRVKYAINAQHRLKMNDLNDWKVEEFSSQKELITSEGNEDAPVEKVCGVSFTILWWSIRSKQTWSQNMDGWNISGF